MVDGVVQEQHLGRLHQDGGQGQQAVVHQSLHAGTQGIGQEGAGGADQEHADNGQGAAQNAHGEVVDQHLEASGDAALHAFVKPLDQQAAQGTGDHGTDEHGDVGAHDDTQGGNGARHGAPLAAHHLAAGIADQQGKEVVEHGGDHLCDGFIGEPAVRDEQGGDEAPGNEGADVGHDHAAEEPPKFLHAFFHGGISFLYSHTDFL